MKGHKGKTFKRRLYSVYQSKVALISLCYLHDIELFLSGESAFLKAHIPMAQELVTSPGKYSEGSAGDDFAF
tara:strand:+ start:9324 stop:9539 length:216 start_codon:yes stop_codon:yes gene_type:complete